MVDFNTKKNILKKLRKARSENKLLWLPCVIAAAFVKLWYGTVCRIGMALSDRNGNFLGIKMPERQSKSRRQDDIVYVKKPFIGRLVSVVLAAAFVLMVAPELNLVDLGVRVSAAGFESTVTVKEGDDEIPYLIAPDVPTDSNTHLIKESDYLAAKDYTIEDSSIVCETSDKGIYISWRYGNTPPAPTRYGVKVVVTEVGSGNIINGDKVNGEIFSNAPGKTEVTYSGNEYAGKNVKVSVYLIVNLDQIVVKGDLANGDTFDPSGDGKAMVVPTNEKYHFISEKYIESGEANINAKISVPSILKITEKDESDNYNEIYKTHKNSAYVVWSPVYQVGGTEDGEPATGYVIWRKKDNENWRQHDIVLTTALENNKTNDGNYKFYDDKGIDYGCRYQYYVEPYRVIWGGGTIYKENDPSVITSGNNPNGGEKTLYIAPNTPTIKCERNFTAKGDPFYEITVSRETGKNNYTGVLLFRTEDGKLESSLAEGENYDTFAQWALEKIKGDTTNLYNLSLVKTFSQNETTFSDMAIVEGKTYHYYAVAYKDVDSSTSVIDDTLYAKGYSYGFTKFSLDSFKATKPPKPTLNITDDQITVDWDVITGAESYEIEIVQTGTHNEKNETVPIPEKDQTSRIEPANSNTYPDKDLLYSDRYKYRIRGVVNMDTMTPKLDANGEVVKDENGNTVYEKVTGIYTKWSDWVEGTVGTRIGTPTVTDVVSADGQLTVKWTAVSGAAGYYLEYQNINNSNDKGTITVDNGSTSHVHRNLKNGNVYRYRVCAYKEIKIPGRPKESQLVSGNYSDWYTPVRVGDELLIPQNLKLTTKDGEITATWNPVKGATGYILYSKKDGTYGEPDEFRVSGNTFTQTGLSNGDVYTYQVRAIKRVNGEDDPSELSTPASIKVGEELTTPQNLKATTRDGEITISWTAVGGAKGYKLWYRKAGSGTFTSIDVTKSPFTHTGLNNGDVYEYYVAAYKEVNGKIVPGPESVTITQMVGSVLDSPKDFTVTANDGKADLKWTAVKGAEGYIIHASSGGRYYQFDVSKVTYTHSDLSNGDVWTYYVTAYKTVNGTRTYSNPSEPKTVTIGISLNSAVDLTATAGNRQIDLKWTAVKGAEGYVVYLYNSKTMEFEPITVTSKTSYSHVGLKNGKQYTYMVAPYKTINGKRFYGDYSLSVTAIPTTGSITDIDHELKVKGTAPYGISHGEYIKATSNHGAFDESVDVYFTTNRKSTQAVRDVLKNYANGLSSFIIYPFDISIYRENTHIEVDPADGYTVTITMPVPDRLIAYRDYITVVHIGDGVYEAEEMNLAEDWLDNYDRKLEVLPCAIVDIDNVWCVQFKCSDFSPFALVIYKEHIQDVASGGGLLGGDFADTFNSGVLLFTALPDIMPHNRKLRIVQSGSKRYRIKSVTKK